MTTVTQRARGRPAHPAGPTFLKYTPNGRKLVTTGTNSVIRVYETGSDGEPINIDDCQENNTAVATSNSFFLTGSEDGAVCMQSLETYDYQKMLVRSTLPIRDIALSPDGKWAAVASDELSVRVVNTEDELKIFHLRGHSKPAKHLTFHPSGTYLAVSCTDGIIYLYSLSTEEPTLMRQYDGITRPLQSEEEASSRAVWHPDGRAFAAPTATRDIVVVSWDDGARQKVFSGGHMADVTACAWSPNGALLATAGKDRKILLWESKSQKIIARYDYQNVINLDWHPNDKNLLSFTSSDGEVFIHNDFVPQEHSHLLRLPLQPAPFLHPPGEKSGNASRPSINGLRSDLDIRSKQRSTRVELANDDLDVSDIGLANGDGHGDDEDDGFVDDDDGAGYAAALNGNGKRVRDRLDPHDPLGSKRVAYEPWAPRVHPAFQSGSTPWRGNRRYLCLNLTGFVWTVDQDVHHTVTVEFYDRDFQRDFHFADPFLYDKACLNEHGTLFSCPPKDDTSAIIYYRPHETWTARADWKIQLPPGEAITSLALSSSYIVATTSTDYLRVYSLFGTPIRVSRLKSSPSIACASWRDYILTVGNGAVASSGKCTHVYTLENVRRDEICQADDVVALTEGSTLASIFFSDAGDPCSYDSAGVLLVLQHWRQQGQARWVPLLDTKTLDRLASGRKTETYWPVAVANQRFHCIILKGGDRYPYFPRPLLSDFAFEIPVGIPLAIAAQDDADSRALEGLKLEESLVRTSLMHSLMADLLGATTSTAGQRAALGRLELDTDKLVLQLVNVECREGDERGMKALELVGLLKDRTGRMLQAAEKVAARYDRNLLETKIRELAERRLGGEDMDEEE